MGWGLGRGRKLFFRKVPSPPQKLLHSRKDSVHFAGRPSSHAGLHAAGHGAGSSAEGLFFGDDGEHFFAAGTGIAFGRAYDHGDFAEQGAEVRDGFEAEARKLLWPFSLRPTPQMSNSDFRLMRSRNAAVVGLW